jgi:hypothetical protein
MDHANYAIPPLQSLFDGAKRFGLNEAEVWQAFEDSVDEVGADATLSEYVQQLTGELARRILHRQRCSPSEERVHSGRRR